MIDMLAEKRQVALEMALRHCGPNSDTPYVLRTAEAFAEYLAGKVPEPA